MRRAYLAMVWRTDDDDACAQAAAVAAAMMRDGPWLRAHAAEGLMVWTHAACPPPLRLLPEGSGLILGRTYPMPGPDAAGQAMRAARARSAADHARHLSRQVWGAYVAILRDPACRRYGVYRDPSAGLDALCWSLSPGVHLVGSQISPLPIGVGPRHPLLNWDRIADFVAIPTALTATSLLDDVTVVGAGEFRALEGEHSRAQSVWDPTGFACDPIDDPLAAAEELRARVDLCVAALIGDHDRVTLELSGGLDSSIIAGSIASTGQSHRIVDAINFSFSRRESDESGYAREVAERLGAPLTVFTHHPEPLDEARVSLMAKAFLPGVNGIVGRTDEDEIARLRACRSEALVSGQGGDAVFFQMPSSAVAADAIARQGLRAWMSACVADVARRKRQSVWQIAKDVRRLRSPTVATPELCSSLVPRELASAASHLTHDWVARARARDLLPGKRVHIQAAAGFLGNQAARRRREEADILFPLFGQPVLEHCLRIPTPVLAGGSYDRAFARETFGDRIPDSVRLRRAKGMVTVYFAKVIAASLPFLRDYLLHGCLCAAGVLDRRSLERALDRNDLILNVKTSDILWAVAVEAWVRHWQTRAPDSRSTAWRR